MGVDATPIPTFARPDRRERRTKKGVAPVVKVHSADPDADWYHRDKRDHLDAAPDASVSQWAYEASLAVSGTDDPNGTALFPSLVVGMAPLHKPGHRPGENAVRALASVRERGHPARFVAGDRAYTQSKPEDFQLPVRALGYEPVLDYKIDQLGRQASHHGMLLVDGTWYCPAIPESLIDATKDFRSDLIDEESWRARIEERTHFAMRIHSKPDPEGYVRLQCPAAGPSPAARCELKPSSNVASKKARTRIPVRDVHTRFPQKVCVQQSVTLPPEPRCQVRPALCPRK